MTLESHSVLQSIACCKRERLVITQLYVLTRELRYYQCVLLSWNAWTKRYLMEQAQPVIKIFIDTRRNLLRIRKTRCDWYKLSHKQSVMIPMSLYFNATTGIKRESIISTCKNETVARTLYDTRECSVSGAAISNGQIRPLSRICSGKTHRLLNISYYCSIGRYNSSILSHPT